MIDASDNMPFREQPTFVTALFLEHPVGSGRDFSHPALNANRMSITRSGWPRIMQAQRCPCTRLVAVTPYADNDNHMARRSVTSGVLVRLPKHVEHQGTTLKCAAQRRKHPTARRIATQSMNACKSVARCHRITCVGAVEQPAGRAVHIGRCSVYHSHDTAVRHHRGASRPTCRWIRLRNKSNIVQNRTIGFMPVKRIMRAGAYVAINNQPFAPLKCFYRPICLISKNAVRLQVGAGSDVGVQRALQVFDKNAAGTGLKNFNHKNYPQLAKVRSLRHSRQNKFLPGSQQIIHNSTDSHKRAAVTGGVNV
jgi:hypothetical protein